MNFLMYLVLEHEVSKIYIKSSVFTHSHWHWAARAQCIDIVATVSAYGPDGAHNRIVTKDERGMLF